MIFFLVACGILLQRPCIGVSDILDYWRVMRPAGIEHLQKPVFPGYYVQCRYRTEKPKLMSLPSSSSVLAYCSRGLSFVFNTGKGFLDLRQIGLLYILLMTAVLLAAGWVGLPFIESCLLAWIALDPGYLLFFNSFYADPSLFVALVGVYCWFRWNDIVPANPKPAGPLSHSSGIRGLASFSLVGLCLLGGGSKMQYITFPPAVLLSLFVVQITRPSFRSRRIFVLEVAVVIVAFGIGWNFLFGPGPRFLKYNNYNAVFGGIAKASGHPQEALARLGIRRDFRNLPRKDIWSAGMTGDHPVHAELAELSRVRLAWEYLSDPGALFSACSEIGRELEKTAAHPRGNRVRPKTDTHATKRVYEYPFQYSSTFRKVYSGFGLSLLLLLIISGVLPFFAEFRGISTTAFLLAWIASQFVVAVLGEGFVNLHQHLIGARLGIDLLAINLVMTTVLALPRSLVGKFRTFSQHQAPKGETRDL